MMNGFCKLSLCWHTLRGARLGALFSRGGGLWPYPALRRCNPFGIGTGTGMYTQSGSQRGEGSTIGCCWHVLRGALLGLA